MPTLYIKFELLLIQLICLILLIVTKNNFWAIGSAGLLLPNSTYPSKK